MSIEPQTPVQQSPTLRRLAARRARGTLLVLLIAMTVFLAGAVWHRYRLFPFPQIRGFLDQVSPVPQPDIPDDFIRFVITPYQHRLPVYSNREYSDTVGDPILDGKLLVQIPRHHDSEIVLDTRHPVTIYRMLSPENDNSVFSDWQQTAIRVHIEGWTCTLETVVTKDYPPGRIALAPGGPIAASPILIEVHGKQGPDFGVSLER